MKLYCTVQYVSSYIIYCRLYLPTQLGFSLFEPFTDMVSFHSDGILAVKGEKVIMGALQK
jgi:hypothetical protein